MTPAAVLHRIVDSPVGELTLVGDGVTLTGLYFPGHTRRPVQETLGDVDDLAFGRAVEQLAEYFAGQRTEFDVPLALRGNAFQRKVWAQLALIPYGQTRSYGQLAVLLGDPGPGPGGRGGQRSEPDFHHRALSPGRRRGRQAHRVRRRPGTQGVPAGAGDPGRAAAGGAVLNGFCRFGLSH